ncbi:MAG: alpha/beta hydrolase [Betaproteobacteria bacterium]|nr:alpha/beta hydrolase [Betaproteobacteria bacterium]
MKSSASHFHDIRGLRYHVRTWGEPHRPRFFLLHGWMDVSASFQFVVDSLARDWHVIAPDWRGFGLTGWAREGYWFPDYYADLDRLLDLYSADAPAQLVGHSMGGNIALTYAGLRPQRIAKVTSLDGFGLARTRSEDAPARLRHWLDGLAEAPRFRDYRSFEEVAARLRQGNPRLDAARAQFLAQHWAKLTAGGRIVLRADPSHKLANPYLSRIEELIACWREVRAPVLWVFARESKRAGYLKDTPEELTARKAPFTDYREAWIEDCGHMMHFDQPRELARLIEAFLADSDR